MSQLPLFLPESGWEPPTELPDLRRVGLVALDRETKDDGLAAGRGPGWAVRAGYTAGIGVAWREGSQLRSLYLPLRHPETACLDPEQVARWEDDHYRAGVRFVFHNAPYDLGWARAEHGTLPPDNLDDTTAMAVMIDENKLSYKLDRLAREYGLEGKDETLLREAAAAYGYHGTKVKENLWRLPARFVGPYGAGDAEQTLLLSEVLRPMLEEQGLQDAYQLEMDLIPMIQEMRLRGIRVDTLAAEEALDALKAQRDVVLTELSEKLGRTVRLEDIRKVKNLEAWHDAAKISYPRTPKTAVGSFTAGWMRKHEHWLPRLVARADQLEEAGEKFVRGFILDYAHRGRLHASINQFKSDEGGTKTHRFSYSDPALQQMPGDKQPELKAIIRGLFLPEEGEVWGALDYSQQEYRLIVHFACRLGLRGAAEAKEMYASDANTDFHQMVADMTNLPRRTAKDVNFAKVYGAGIPKFAGMTGMSLGVAQETMDQYDELLPFPKLLDAECKNLAGQRGWIRMLDGARMHFDRWEPAWRDGATGYPRPLDEARKVWPGIRLKRAFTHKAMNALIQGSAARQTKLAMRAWWREKILPLLQMHDELSASFSDQKVALRAQEIMRDVVRLEVPMAVDAEFGPTWGAASKKKDAKGETTYAATWAEAVELV